MKMTDIGWHCISISSLFDRMILKNYGGRNTIRGLRIPNFINEQTLIRLAGWQKQKKQPSMLLY